MLVITSDSFLVYRELSSLLVIRDSFLVVVVEILVITAVGRMLLSACY